MNIIFSTGCPNSGWDVLLPMLSEAGLNSTEHDLKHWFNSIYHEMDINMLSQKYIQFLPDKNAAQRLSDILSESSSEQIFLADNNNVFLLDFWATEYPHTKFILFYTSPEYALMHAIPKGLNPIDFLNEWQLANRQLIQFLSKHRQNTMLLDAQAAYLHPEELNNVCKDAGVNIQAIKQTPGGHDSNNIQVIDKILITNLCSSEAVKELSIELEARAVPLGKINTWPKVDPDALYNYYKQQKEESQNQKILEVAKKEMEEENALLLMQLNQLEKELEDYYSKNHELVSDIESEKNKYSKLKSHLEHVIKNRDARIKQWEQDRRQFDIEYQRLLKEMEHQRKANEMKSNSYIKYINKLKKNLCRQVIFPLRLVILYLSQLKVPKETRKQRILLIKSGLFDKQWYLNDNPDVAITGCDPVLHYLQHGATEGRNPSVLFNTLNYINNYPDVASSNINPLLHFIKYGINEGRKPVNN